MAINEKEEDIVFVDNLGDLEHHVTVEIVNAIFQGGGASLSYQLVTLKAYNWKDNLLTINVPGVSSTKIIWVYPTKEDQKNYDDFGVQCIEQDDEENLIFECETEPTTDLTVQIVIGGNV